MSIRDAVEDAVSASEPSWRVEVARTLADALDETPNASMARELRAVMHDIAALTVPKVVGPADELRRRRAVRTAQGVESPSVEEFGGG